MKPAFVLVLAGLGLAGCATDIPSPRGFDSSTQQRVRAARHWDIVATDIAKQTKAGLAKLRPGRPVYLNPPSNPSQFDAAMHELIATRLIDAGLTVNVRREGALDVTYSTRLIDHKADFHSVDVPLTAIAAGVMVAYNVLNHWSSDNQRLAVLASAAGLDVAGQRLAPSGNPSTTELMVTTSVSDGTTYLVRKTDIYYIDDRERSLFAPSSGEPSVPIRNYRIEGPR